MQFGVAAAGPRDDGAYYQALVTKVEEFSEANGYEPPIIVDNITAEDAATELANIAEQGVDVITVGASEIADPLADLVEQYPDIFWYCNCGAGYPENPGLAQSQDDASEINYSAGYATGLLLQDSGGDSAVVPRLLRPRLREGVVHGLRDGPAGGRPVVHDDVRAHGPARSTSTTRRARPRRSTPPSPRASTRSTRSSAAPTSRWCSSPTRPGSSPCRRDRRRPAIATTSTTRSQVRFDAGDYLDPILAEIQSGEFQEGDVRVFHVGVDPEPGAEICDPTPEQQTAMDEVYSQIAAGDFAEQFGQIKAEAYAGG